MSSRHEETGFLKKPGFLFFVGACLAVPAAAFGQTPAMRTVEFNDAIKEALVANPTVGQAQTAVARANALVAQAKALRLPSVGVGLTSTTLDSARGFSGGITQPQNQFTVSANVQYNVDGWVAAGQARDQVVVATASSAEARLGVAVAAAQAYLAVISARRQVQVSDRAVEVAQQHLDFATRRLDAGAGSRVNELRAAQALTSDQLQQQNGQLALRRAQEALGVVLAADGPVDAGAEPSLDVPANVDEADWMNARPDLQTDRAVQRAAERVVRDSWIDWAPLPSLAFTPQVVAPKGLFQPSKTWRFTISMVQPVFDGGQRRAERRARQTAVDSAKLTFDATEIRARSEVRIAQESVTRLQQALTTARTAVEQANQVLQITTAAFEVGATTNIEVIDAQRSVRDAESAAASAEDAVRQAKLDLLVALGRFPQ